MDRATGGAAPTTRGSRCSRAAGSRARCEWSLIGAHNMENALAAIAAARHAGVPCRSRSRRSQDFQGIARRMQLRGEVHGVRVYDDFAHHPTAIATTLDGLRRRVGEGAHRRGARTALADHAHGRAPGHARALARGRGRGVAVRAARSGLGHRRGRGALGARGHVGRDIDALVRELAGTPAPRRPRARS